MVQPKFYEALDRESAIAAFGTEEDARILCDGEWVIWSDVAVCFAEIGDAPQKSHFVNGTTFTWVAAKPYRFNGDSQMDFLPTEVFGPEGRKRTIWLFVRPSTMGPYSFIGQLKASHMRQVGNKHNFGEAQFDFSPTLPSKVWTQIGGLVLGDLEHATLDAGLATLRHTKTAAERLEILKMLIRFWHGEISSDDGLPENECLGIELPPVLEWWYRYAGRTKNILSGQNALLSPAHLRITPEGLLVFYGENQWCYEWATSLDGDDPQVFGRDGDPQPWEPEGITLSEHLILACLFEGIMCHSGYGASAAWLNTDTVARIIEHIPPIASTGWNWSEKTRFYAGNGAFMYTMCNVKIDGQMGYSIWIGAKTEMPLQFLKTMVSADWEYVSV